MPETNASSSPLTPHVEDTIRSMARLHAEHRQNGTPLQRWVDSVTAKLGQPQSIGVLSLIMLTWIGYNLLAEQFGLVEFDRPPFPLLCTLVSIVSLYLVFLILASQRREDELAQLREQVTLEMAILNEQKTTKVIKLLEELRRDDPLVRNRVDLEANEFAEPADPQTVFNAIKNSRAQPAGATENAERK